MTNQSRDLQLHCEYLELLEAMYATAKKGNALNPARAEYIAELDSDRTESVLAWLWILHPEYRERILSLDPGTANFGSGAARDSLRTRMERFELKHEKAMRKDIEPLAKSGWRVKKGAAAGHQATHGTNEEKKARWGQQQEKVDEIRLKHPNWPKSEVARLAAKECGCSPRTIRRNCTVPPAQKK